jgi:hypothetical protein
VHLLDIFIKYGIRGPHLAMSMLSVSLGQELYFYLRRLVSNEQHITKSVILHYGAKDIFLSKGLPNPYLSIIF